MPKALLASAYEAAQNSEPEVRAAALLRIARVQTALDRGQARRTFEQALQEVRHIPGRNGAFLHEHARLFAAAIAPDLLQAIPSAGQTPRDFEAESLCRTMIEHGNTAAALELLMHHEDARTFPFSVVGMLIEKIGGDERLALLRRAVVAWREAPGHVFVWLFRARWNLLPEEEAREVVREVVRVALDGPDQPAQATYDQEGTVRITSLRDHTLFEVLHILRHLDPPLVESLIASHPQFAAAARRFPYGMETIHQEAEERRKSEGERCGGGFIMCGDPADFPYMRALMEGSRNGDFEQAIEHAVQKYREDAGPEDRNQAPLEFWPSAGRFRSILYAAGKRLGADAGRYLTRIDDPGLRLFAQIELAAAQLGLPEFHSVQRAYRPRPRRVPRARGEQGPPVLGPSGEEIRCPKCRWIPR
jgi:hypothetical protein